MSQSRRHDELLAREIAFSNQFFESRQSQAAHSQHPCSKDPVCPLPKNKITSHLRVETRSIDAHQNQKRPETCFCRTLPWHQQTPTEPTEAVATLNQKLQQVSERLIWIPKHWKKRAPVSMDCSNVGTPRESKGRIAGAFANFSGSDTISAEVPATCCDSE